MTGLSAVLMAFGQVIGVFFEKQDIIQLVLRLYVIVLSCLIVMNELEWSKYTRDSAILRIWITRGIIYSFVGVLGLDENSDAVARDTSKNSVGDAYATIYFAVVAWSLIVCGMLYFFMGLCCLQMAQDRMRSSYQARQEQAKVTERATFLVRDAVAAEAGGTPKTGTDSVL